jgi:hypothetical protein
MIMPRLLENDRTCDRGPRDVSSLSLKEFYNYRAKGEVPIMGGKDIDCVG